MGAALDIQKIIYLANEQRRQERATARAFAKAVADDNVTEAKAAFHNVIEFYVARHAFRLVGKLEASGPAVRAWFLGIWVQCGDDVRDRVNDDRILIDALRVLLAPYGGNQLTLFRGETFRNYRYRSYGLSWTTNIEVAKKFAISNSSHYVDGCVVISTVAPASAIICAASSYENDPYNEAEYILDRWQLRDVEILRDYPPNPQWPAAPSSQLAKDT